MKKTVLPLLFVAVSLLAFALIAVYDASVNNSPLGTVSSSAASPVAPEFEILSPKNETYDTSDVPLSLATNESSCQFQYALDGQENVTFAGNATLTDLSNGLHNITVRVCSDSINISSSSTTAFQIAKPPQTQTPPVRLPSASGSFGPLGGFGVMSPSNTTYYSSTVTVEIRGQVIVGRNVQLSMTYSLDGQESLLFLVAITQIHEWDPFIGSISGTVTLRTLSEGSHSLTIYGDLKVNADSHLTQATVHFTTAAK